MSGRITLISMLIVVLAVSLSACETQAPEAFEKYNRYELLTETVDGQSQQMLNGIVELIDSANHRVWVAFEDLTEPAISDALIRALSRGVDVRVVVDQDATEQAGVQRLLAAFTPYEPSGDGELVPESGDIRLADGPTVHTPEPGTDICRSGELNRMTHNFVLIDQTTLINVSGGFPEDWREAKQIGFLASSQDLVRDFEDEFRQLMAGVDATTPSAFNGPLKSIADGRFIYPGTIADFELYFGPQERTLKRVIDRIFSARSSVWIATEQLSNNFVCRALIYKMRAAFDVRLVLKEPIDPTTFADDGACSQLVDEFNKDLPINPGYQHSLRYAPNLATNMVVIDRLDGWAAPTNESFGYVMSQPMLSTLTFTDKSCDPLTYEDSLPFSTDICGECVSATQPVPTALPADAFVDANIWLVRAYKGHPEPALDLLADTFLSIFEEATTP